MKMYCKTCLKPQSLMAVISGPHLKAICSVCGQYFKFMNSVERKMLEDEEDFMDQREKNEKSFWK